MKNVLTAIDKYQKLSSKNKELLIHKFEPVFMKKGTVLIDELELSPYLFFIEKGAIKTYYIDETGAKKLVWFGFEGDICFSMSSYIDIPYIHETIELFEDTQFYRVKIEDIKALFNTNCDWANWGRCFIEHIFATTIKEMDEYKSRTTKERYHDLLEHNANIRERVLLKDIASYLGVSPVTISRLRKDFKNT